MHTAHNALDSKAKIYNAQNLLSIMSPPMQRFSVQKKFANSEKKHTLLMQIRAVLVCKQQTSEKVHQCISSTTL